MSQIESIWKSLFYLKVSLDRFFIQRISRVQQTRLSNESFSQTELFQDDLFPPTQVTWEPVMTAAEWFGGTNRPPRLVSLQPPDMQSRESSFHQKTMTIFVPFLKLRLTFLRFADSVGKSRRKFSFFDSQQQYFLVFGAFSCTPSDASLLEGNGASGG